MKLSESVCPQGSFSQTKVLLLPLTCLFLLLSHLSAISYAKRDSIMHVFGKFCFVFGLSTYSTFLTELK